MIATEIDFRSPEGLDEALQLLADFPDDITVMSGGMSLLPMMNLGLAAPEMLLSLRRIDSLRGIVDEGDSILIGAMVTHAEVSASPLVQAAAPAVATAASLIGDVQVRNRGTIGGSVSHADPAADYVPSLSAHGAEIVLNSTADGERLVPSSEFFIDVMYTAREPHELLTAIRIPKINPGAVSHYIRFARVEGSFAIVNAAVVLDGRNGRIAMGGVGPSPVVMDISEYGQNGWTDAAGPVADAVFEACDQVQGDIMSDADYRREMARVHAKRVVQQAAERLDAGTQQGGNS